MAYTTIKKPSDYFNTKLYTGNATDNTAITGLDFAPNWVWIKNRTGVNSHALFDTVRGATKYIESDTSDAEATDATFLKSFTSDGFVLGTGGRVNNSGQNYASWNWLANGAGSANTDGSISSTVSANTTSGFSIVSWSGSGANATIGHGLGAEPKMIFLKIRTGTNNWQVYNKSIGSGNALFLNTTDASSSNTSWQSTDATSSVFYVSGGGAVNGSGQDFIAYCFAEKQGYSKFGSYTGNGSTDGTFVYTGFKPAFVIIKKTTAGDDWYMNTGKINGYNVQNDFLAPNTSAAEVVDNTAQPIDMISNGFKMRGTGTGNNSSGVSYIYMAFAEEPLVGDNPATAR